MSSSRVELERDLFKRLLELNHIEDPMRTAEEALSLATSITGANQGYMEIFGDGSETPQWSISRGMSNESVSAARERISRGIIGEALLAGKIICTPSALLDERFAERQSVQHHRIEAVMCAPLGEDPAVGVVYLEGKKFSDEDHALLELFARHVGPVIAQSIERNRQREAEDATLEWRAKLSAHRLVGRSRALAHVLQQIALVAPLDLTVLLTGPSGSGKTLVASAIHESSARAKGPFVEINCATLQEPLFESELFGAREGSHSTALSSRPGRVAAAEGGTLFFDEIAELPPGAQPKVLQLLQSGTYFRLGDSTPTRANVRVIAATNADLAQRVADRTFREDLFHRINVFPIAIPGLAERRSDIVPLAEHIMEEIARKQGTRPLPFTLGARLALEIPEWTGNVRELENVVLRGFLKARAAGAERVESQHLFGEDEQDVGELSFHEATRRFQKSLVEKVLQEVEWNVAAAAARLKLARSHVYNLVKTHGLVRKR